MPLPLMAIGAGLGMAGSALQTGLGLAQMLRARRYDTQRPTYEIPQEIGNQLALRQQLLNARMPGARQMERNIAESQAAALTNAQQGASSSEELLAASAASQGSTNRALRDLQMREAQDYENRLRGLESAQNQMAAARDREFQINEMQPYMEDAATRAALTEGGFQNIAGGLASASAQFGKMYEADQMTGSFSGLYDQIKNRFQQRRGARQMGLSGGQAMQGFAQGVSGLSQGMGRMAQGFNQGLFNAINAYF